MLKISSISLFQFKNYMNRSFSFPERITAICGNNGTGKTNLLDAIHYLSFTKSYFTRMDALNVRQGKSGFRLEGVFEVNGQPEKTCCVLRENGKKEFSVNETLYEKFSSHIGRYPCVIIAPDDISMITNGSEERRRFLDSLLSQLDPGYLQHLISYIKIQQQRNSLLKSFADTHQQNFELLEVIDHQLVREGTPLFEKRKEFLVSFLPVVKQLYNNISQQYEDITLVYDSELLQDAFGSILAANRQKDLWSQRTTSGIHKDDIDIRFAGQPFRTIASQGQRKSLLFALKLAEMEVLRDKKGFPPLLLLDDVFEKLDEERISNLLYRVCIENKGQVFITDTNKDRLCKHLEMVNTTYQCIDI
ncbi:MAG: DNA replication and repair protein RecF [Terrimonas sp.]|nr:DNA replication and repair protein RecF [Terrimonas sp.]